MGRAALAFLAVVTLASCGRGTESPVAAITVTLTLPDGRAAFGDDLLDAFRKEQAGEILSVRRDGRVLEVSMKIRELSDINKIKKTIIRLEPGTEYRIEHH